MLRSACLATAVAVALWASAPVAGQGVRTDLLPPFGTVVRATLSSAGATVTAEGELAEAGSQGLVLEASGGRRVYRIPAEVLLGLEVSRGRDHARGAVQGLAYGALGAGLVLGGLAALAGATDSSPCEYFCSRGSLFLLGAAVGGVLGGGVGLAVGAAVGTARWERVW